MKYLIVYNCSDQQWQIVKLNEKTIVGNNCYEWISLNVLNDLFILLDCECSKKLIN